MPTLITLPAPDYPYWSVPLWANQVEYNDQAIAVKVRTVRSRPVWVLSLRWAQRPPATLAVLLDTIHGLAETATEVCLWTPSSVEDRWTLCPVGTGDAGGTLEFIFGAKTMQTGTILVYVDGTPTTEFTAAAKGGDAAGRWAITFNAGHAPADGKAVTCSYNGQRLLSGWFMPGSRRRVPRYAAQAFDVTFRGVEVESTS